MFDNPRAKQAARSSTLSGAPVSVEKICRHFGEFRAVDGVSIDIHAGEFVSLLGPSGSGKTTLLMMIAGFEPATSGRITIDGKDMTHVPPNLRNIGMVFQKYALFPHKTVAENIAFPLRMRRLAKDAIRERVDAVLAMVELQGYGERMPAQLSGGQQQRVALARAIVFQPPVLLMDEPLGALDRKLRLHMQLEIKHLQARLGCTVIYVTHDQEEALTMSDRVVVMQRGQLQQIGSPEELYERPASKFVADFIGETNLLPVQLRDLLGEKWTISVDGEAAHARAGKPFMGTLQAGERATLSVRPERLRVRPARPGAAGLSGSVRELVYLGASAALIMDTSSGLAITARMPSGSDLSGLGPGEPVSISWDPEHAILFPEGRS